MATRRDFIKATMASGAAVVSASAVSTAAAQGSAAATAPGKRTFKLKYAPHFGMFKYLAGEDLIDQLKFAADQGFTALEDNGMRGRSVEEQEKIAREMTRLNMAMGVFVVNMRSAFGPTVFTGTDTAARDGFLEDCRASVEVAKRVNATWMTVVPGNNFHRLAPEHQTQNCIDLLKQASEIFEPHGLVMVLEPLNFRDHPDLFLQRTPQAYMICRAVNSPACKILFDIYHQQITEGNLIPNIDLAWSEIGYFQCGDNPGRKEPGTGEINYRNVFGHIHRKGFTGIVGMEHGKSSKSPEGEQAVIDAYVAADAF